MCSRLCLQHMYSFQLTRAQSFVVDFQLHWLGIIQSRIITLKSYIHLEASCRYKLSKSRLEVIVHFQVGFTTFNWSWILSTDTNNVFVYVCICVYFCIAEPNTGVSVYMELSPSPPFSFSQDTLHISSCPVFSWFLVKTSLV